MAKNENEVSVFFPIEKKGYEKTSVDKYISKINADCEKKLNELRTKNDELRDKNDKITEELMNLQSQKNEIATVLMNAEATAAGVIEDAKKKAAAESEKLDEEIEYRKRLIVKENEEIRQMRLDADVLFENFASSLKNSAEEAKNSIDSLMEEIIEKMAELKNNFSESFEALSDKNDG